jgi:hypothetical protein
VLTGGSLQREEWSVKFQVLESAEDRNGLQPARLIGSLTAFPRDFFMYSLLALATA